MLYFNISEAVIFISGIPNLHKMLVGPFGPHTLDLKDELTRTDA